MIDFWSLTDEEILQGLAMVVYPNKQDPTHPMRDFYHKFKLQKLAVFWLDCNRDRTLMKIRYSEEIAELEQSIPWLDL